MEFLDFQLRAWQADSGHVDVLVHGSPAGTMDRPVRVAADLAAITASKERFGDYRAYNQFKLQEIFELGLQLSEALLAPPVWSLFDRSLRCIGPDDGLRLRLCLDTALWDLPWEFLYRPDRPAGALAGFLSLDPRISLVRGAPTLSRRIRPTGEAQRLVFLGALWRTGDQWLVEEEYAQLRAALAPAAALLGVDPFRPASGRSIETALLGPAAILHYSGHTDRDGQRGYLVREVVPQADGNQVDRLYSDQLAPLLDQAGVTLAVFSACNSGYRVFAEPLMAAGLPALIGVQGPVTNVSSARFCDVIYRFIGAGLSLDEAVTAARAALVTEIDPDRRDSFDWGRFMVYLAAQDGILLPRPASLAAVSETARNERQFIVNVAGDYIASQVETSGGAYIGGNVTAGGNVVGRDQGPVAVAGAQEPTSLCVPLLTIVAREAPPRTQAQAVRQVLDLQARLSNRDATEDAEIARLVDGLITTVPSAAAAVVDLFATPDLRDRIGPVTRCVLERLRPSG